MTPTQEEQIEAKLPALDLSFDASINYAFQQNAIPTIKELRFLNNAVVRKDLLIRISTEPEFAVPAEIRIQAIATNGEFRQAPLGLRLSHDFLANLTERVNGLLKVEVLEDDRVICSRNEAISLYARNEWCGLVGLPEILAAFVLPNDPAVMPILSRASNLLRESTGRSALNGYQDKSRQRAWEQVAAIYKAIAELGIRYINPPASFENTGQKVRFPSDIVAQKFGTCLDLVLLFAACCEQAGLRPLILLHEGHAYCGCWLEEGALAEPADDDLQDIRKRATDELITVFETTTLAQESPGTLNHAELLAKEHLVTEVPFRLALDVHRARMARIHPLPIAGDKPIQNIASPLREASDPNTPIGIGTRTFAEQIVPPGADTTKPASRIDQWKSRLLDLSLRNRLLNFRETNSTIRILSAEPEKVEDELAASRDLALQHKPKVMGEKDPRHAVVYSEQQKADAMQHYLRDELVHGRLHTSLEEAEHSRRLTELFRAARNSMEENGTNTLFAAVGILEWRETEHADRVHRAPLLLVPVELKRKSVIEGFSLRRLDEETRLNVTLMEMLRQNFRKEIGGLDPLPEDESGVNVAAVFQLFRDAVRNMMGWEVKTEVWLGQFSFTKFLLWKDLSDRLEVLTRNRIVNHLVNEAGTPYPNPATDVKPQDLDDKFHPQRIFCPRSADSSQLAAVMAAAAGYDFVLEGPPGTGKSQTITNIIAHCLAEGKRVLFVAEKRAALDVVHRRLREDGLEPFCLELHSNKIGKADVLAQFDRSLKFAAENRALDWGFRTSELEKARNALNTYTRALHKRAACGLSAYSCLDYLLPRKDEIRIRLDFEVCELSIEGLEKARLVAKQLHDRSVPLIPLLDHPLGLIGATEWSPNWADRTLELIRTAKKLAESANESYLALRHWLRYSGTTVSRKHLDSLDSLCALLLAPEPVGSEFATTSWSVQEHDLANWCALIRERNALRDRLRSVHLNDKPNTQAIASEKWDNSAANQILDKSKALLAKLTIASAATAEIRAWLSAPTVTASRSELAGLVTIVDSLRNAYPVTGSFVETHCSSWTEKLDHWIRLVRERSELRVRLSVYDETKLLALELQKLLDSWTSARTTWFLPKWFKNYHIQSQLLTARLEKSRPEVASMGETLRHAIRLQIINQDLAKASEEAVMLLGIVWNYGEPSADVLEAARSWGITLHERIDALSHLDPAWGSILRTHLAALLNDGLAATGPSTLQGKRLESFGSAIVDFDEVFDDLAKLAELERRSIDAAADHLEATRLVTELLVSNIPRLREINVELASARPLAEARLGMVWNRGEPASDALHGALDWGKKLHAQLVVSAGDDLAWLGQLRMMLAEMFREGSSVYAPGTTIGERMVTYRLRLAELNEGLNKLHEQARMHREQCDKSTDFFATILRSTERLSESWHMIREWCHWQKARAEARQIGLLPLVEYRESVNGTETELPSLFERSFRQQLFFSILEQEPVLREFFGREHAERIERFRDLDGKVAALARDLIRARLAERIPDDQNMQEVPKAEIGLLRKELGKRMRHIPVRQLISRIPALLSRLKPCVLMSPLSVAQYLDPSHQAFDVVIFDEASQIPVWDAVGAIARGTQLIVVGDPKQLPPTNFFNSRSDDEDDLTPEEHKDLESILDELMTNGLRHKSLQWHYRSRHESLITFSNRQYYANNLLTFPSPELSLGGVRFRHLPQARYDKGKSRTNRGEAEALVKELVGRLRDKNNPMRSYGVVTFSLAQQQLVENLLDEERRKYPDIEVHFGDEPPVEGEPVFVKNLENVQGDERDVIFFSICYGIDENGKISMNFGPLNRDGGERRLNVAVTRAKHEIVVFSGIKADHIDLTRTGSRGVRDLKYFLDYADRGPKALSVATSADADGEAESEFESLVAQRIRAAGYEVHHQVGCSGYRIDLGVLDPGKPGRYLLGVECDGATYHRAATARDRDKLRQAVLEDLGWQLHRIWSTDWWHDADKETAKLVQVIQTLSPPK